MSIPSFIDIDLCMNLTESCHALGACVKSGNAYSCDCVPQFDPATNCSTSYFETPWDGAQAWYYIVSEYLIER